MDHTQHLSHYAAQASPESLGAFFHRLMEGYMPRQECMYHQADVIWLHIVSDTLIALAYYSIPIALYYFVRRRKDLSYNWMFMMFAGFILACGTTHLFNIIAIWHPLYRLDGLIKLFTGTISIITAVALWPLIPKALALPSPSQLRQANDRLEIRVYERTAELAETNTALQLEISERRRAETALRESEERFRTMTNSIPQLAWMANPDGAVSWFNQRWYEYTGSTPEQMEGWGWQNVHDPAVLPKVMEQWRSSVAFGQPFEMEFPLRGADGRFRRFLTHVLPLRTGGGQVVQWLGTNTDITERAEAAEELERKVEERTAALASSEEALRRANEGLTQAARRKDEFLAMLAHELRNPLAPICNAVQIQKTFCDASCSKSEYINHQREMIARQVGHMSRLLDDLLDVSRITRGKIQLRREQLDLCAVAEHAVESMRSQIDARQLVLKCQVTTAPLRVDGDPTRLEQVLRNLLHNAVKYTEPGGRIWLTVQEEATGGAGRQAVVSIRDSGEGIAPELLEHIFEPFVQAEQSLARTQGGLGIGLSMVKSLVELHGGQVEAHSGGRSQGSEFVVRLPLLAGVKEQAEAARFAEPPMRAQEAGLSRRVLVVDDNEDAAASLGDLLEIWGQQSRTVYDGRQALAVAHAWRPEVILLDIGLPGMDGYEVARRLREDPVTANAYLVALTGYGAAEDRQRALEAGFDRHMTKPVDLECLQALLGQAHAA